jgi:AraC family transcriptional regulator
VVEFIRSNLEAERTVTQTASVAGISPAHFARSFRLATGSTPHEFVSHQRLALAKMRLLREDGQIAEIALAAGFSSQGNFSRAFRKAVSVHQRGKTT